MTLASIARHAIEVKKSRFVSQAMPASDAAAAASAVAALSDPSASHNCWAWRTGASYRSSDDGEPGGTAGRPILQAIDAQGMDRVVVVVSRWFGGIKLGAGGLARAYGGAAAECLRLADRVALVELAHCRVECGFDDLGTAHALLEHYRIRKLDETFTAHGVVLTLEATTPVLQDLEPALRDATRNRARLHPLPTPPSHG